MMRRWLRFHAVGLLGLALQLAVLAALTELAGVHYLWATIAAVQTAVLHNFFWHELWTWRDRRPIEGAGLFGRLVKFTGATGVVSLAGNTALMSLTVGGLGLPPLYANLLAVASCALVNFLVNDRFVFLAVAGGSHPGSAGCR